MTMRTFLWVKLAALTLALGCGQQTEMTSAAGTSAVDRESRRTGAADAVPAGQAGVAGSPSQGAPGTTRAFEADPTPGDVIPPSDGRIDPDNPLDPDNPVDPDDPDGDRPKMARELSFDAWRRLEATLRHTLDGAELMQEIPLQETEVDRSLSVVQAKRPTAVDEHIQGVGSEDITESFLGEADRQLDVLLVLDNGCSMEREARHMADKLSPLLDRIAETDWQIGVVTTDPSQSCLRALIKKGDANVRDALAAAVKVGTQGSSNPRALLQAVRSLSGECLQQPWIRQASNVELLFVSDKDNCVDGKSCPGKDYAQGAFLKNYLGTIRTVGKNAHVHGVFMPPEVEKCDCKSAEEPGKIFAQLVRDTGGAAGSICSEDYTPALDAIAGNVAGALRRSFTLARNPVVSTVRVYVEGVELTSGFTVSGRVVTLDTPLATNARLQVVYRDVVTTPQTRFAMRFAPLAATITVNVDGVTPAPGSYAVELNPPAIVFQTPPAANARIAIAYTRDVPLQTRFDLGAPVIAGTLAVTLDGAVTAAYQVDEAAGVVTFDQPPAEDSALFFTFKSRGAPILRYPVTIPVEPGATVAAVDKATGMALVVKYENGFLDVDPSSFAPSRIVVVKYPNPARDEFTVSLPQDPVTGTVIASAGGVTCTMAPELVVSGRDLAFDGCPFPADATEVVISYQYWFEVQEFVFDVENFPAPNDYQMWTVWVNDVETTDYRRDGKTITFLQSLPLGAVVRVRLEQLAPSTPAS